MSRIFLSHSSANNAEAVALRDWLEREGWKDEVFLDIDSVRGIAAGERWERRLNEAASRCEAVLFLVSKDWIASGWCRKELNLAHRLNKRLFGVLIEDLTVAQVPQDLSGDWQLVRLATGRDHITLRAVLPVTHEEIHVTFSQEGLQRLKHGLEQVGLDPKHFDWPPASDPDRPPYRGLRPLESDDAGIFFGRDAQVIEALDRLRGLRETLPPRLLVILGASGAGKSSFMRAGLLPRLMRDDRHFLPLPPIRPERAAISGETGLLRAIDDAMKAANMPITRANLRAAVEGGAETLRPILQSLIEEATPAAFDNADKPKPPALIISIDQGEELFLAEGQDEARKLLAVLCGLLREDAPTLIVLFTIRSDSYERLQLAKELEGVHQETLSLPPMPKGSYAEVIKGPALRLTETTRALKIEDSLVNALLVDIEEGGAKDSLPLLSFTLERLYVEYGGAGRMMLADYEALGRIKGSIEAAVDRAFKEADKDSAIPKDRNARLALLRRGLIPWLAGIDPESGSPRRRVARKSEIPAEARPLIDYLVDQRLLATDVTKETGEQTIEPVHEALLRQWGLLQGWLAEDTGLLGVLEGVKRASRDWAANGKDAAWLTHATNRLEAAERLLRGRADLAANFEQTDREYLAACRDLAKAAQGRTRRMRAAVGVLALGLAVGLVGWWQQAYLNELRYWFTNVRSYVLTAEVERALKPKQSFKECTNCPEMVVVPAGKFTMGSPEDELGHYDEEGPQHDVKIAKPFAVAKFEATFDEWDTCFELGGCKTKPVDQGWGRGRRPVINVSWNDAQEYVEWLSKLTGKPYRLLSESEWEYAARAGSDKAYFWGSEIGKSNANCDGCGTQWDKKQTAPVGSFTANEFGLHDMHGNVWEIVQDCYQKTYDGEPTDGSANSEGDCFRRVVRGGSWISDPQYLRSASRYRNAIDDKGNYNRGFRVARTLNP